MAQSVRRPAVARLFAATAMLLLATPAIAAERPSLSALVAGPQRSPANVARDPYRHPEADLRFLGIRPDSAVIEILPGAGGYWTEILAPYVAAEGRYVAANGPKDSTSDETRRDNAGFAAKMAADPADYAKVETAEFAPGRIDLGPPSSADVVLTFRNVHNWMANGTADAAFASFFRVLKAGGILGVEEHRGPADQPQDPLAKSGYVRQDTVIALAEKAGFRLLAASEINANPKDTKDYPAGVWTLPPTYRLKDQDHARYQAIGESDRMLLRFEKPTSP